MHTTKHSLNTVVTKDTFFNFFFILYCDFEFFKSSGIEFHNFVPLHCNDNSRSLFCKTAYVHYWNREDRIQKKRNLAWVPEAFLFFSVFIVSRAKSESFFKRLRPKMCRPSANT